MFSYKRLGIATGTLALMTVSLAGCAPNPTTPLANTSSTQTANSTKSSTSNSAAPVPNNTNSASTTSSNNTNTASNATTYPATSNNTQNASTTNISSNVSTTSTSQGGQSALPFPNIVNMAMKHFPSNVLNSPEAPTVVPMANAGSRGMYYRTWDTTTGPILSYNVLLSSPQYRLALFSGSTYSGIPAADSIWLPNGVPANGHVTNSNTPLSDGIVAKEQVFVAPKDSAKEVSSNSLTWNEGRWQIKVSRTQSTKAPIIEANAVASYLHTHFMPVPQTKGSIFVNVLPGENAQGQLAGTSVNETIKWQEGTHVYEVDTYSHAKNPIQTGLEMAISMKPYSN